MSGYWEAPNDYWLPLQTGQGSAHSVSSDAPDYDAAERVRQVAEEVSRKKFPVQQKRMGFL